MTSTAVKLKPIRVPNYIMMETPVAKRQEGFKEGPKFAVGNLDDETLIELAEQFKNDLLANAERQRRLAAEDK